MPIQRRTGIRVSWPAKREEETDDSPLTLLRSRTHFGRPEFRHIFASLVKGIEGGSYLPGREATLKTRLGVYFCGVRPSIASDGKLMTATAQQPRKDHQACGSCKRYAHCGRQVCERALLDLALCYAISATRCLLLVPEGWD